MEKGSPVGLNVRVMKEEYDWDHNMHRNTVKGSVDCFYVCLCMETRLKLKKPLELHIHNWN